MKSLSRCIDVSTLFTLLANWKKKKLWNMKETFRPIAIGAFGAVTEG